MKPISKNQLERFPLYLKYLISLQDEGEEYITSGNIANKFNLNEELVKKDLQCVSTSSGIPKKGREIVSLIKDLSDFLGYHNVTDAILIGVGHLGTAFLNYDGFNSFGLNILAGFDVNPDVVGTTINGKPVFPMDKLENLIQRMKIKIAIITVPADFANEIGERLVKAGIEAIWNFAPIHIDATNEIVVENVNLASSLAKLSHKLKTKLEK